MADFCKQCAEEIFGKQAKRDGICLLSDLRGITSKKDYAKGLAAVVICEGCGPIQVDPEGNCVSEDCLKKHKRKQK